MVKVKNDMIKNKDIENIIKKYNYLVKANIEKHFFVYANTNENYYDLYNAGLVGLWKGILDYRDREIDNEYSFKCYLSRCCYTKLSDYVRLNKNKKEGHKGLSDVVNIDKEGYKQTIEDLYKTYDDNSFLEVDELINTYKGEYKEILQLLNKGYSRSQISKIMSMPMSTLNSRIEDIKENLELRHGIKRKPTKHKTNGKVKCIGVNDFEFEKDFDSLKDASEQMQIDICSIRKICQGKRKNAKSKVYNNNKVTFKWNE